MRSRKLPYVLIAVILALSFGLNARMAAHPRSAYQSADERSYGKLAIDIDQHFQYGGKGTHLGHPLHWPPGAPALFAIGHALFPGAKDAQTFDIRSAYWEQALLSTGTTALAALLAWTLAGPWAAVLAAAIVGTYPPLIGATGDQVSEPLGAFLLLAAFAALARAIHRRAGPGRWAAAGALFGLTILTRTDLLPVPFLIAAAGALGVVWRRRAWRRALMTWGMVAIATVLVLAPWTIYASNRKDSFIPVTQGSASALFVGTYLPGGGTTMGMKRAVEAQLRRRHPHYANRKLYKIPAADALTLFAHKHPGLHREEALELEARHNLVHYLRTQPVAFVRMGLDKARRMWLFYYRGGGVHHVSTLTRAWHIALVCACSLGLLAGIRRRRDAVLASVLLTVLFSTAEHAIVVSQARYNLPLMPSLIAAGVAGWWMALRRPAPQRTSGDSARTEVLKTGTPAPPAPAPAA
jgi:4-amino-4-deoxy-L-arabinose transferase-like glycosyltransferase